MDLDSLKASVFICVPFPLLYEKYLPLILEHRINPEIGLDDGTSFGFRWPSFQKIARIIKAEGLKTTIHAPFLEVLPAAFDPEVRKVAQRRLSLAFRVAELFEAQSVVCHTGFVPQWYRGQEKEWLKRATEAFSKLALLAEAYGVPLMVENVFEPGPDLHRHLFSEISSQYLGFCFDAGHQKAFSKSDLMDWLDNLCPYLGQLHLHDNTGSWDDHLPIGAGEIDFEGLFAYLQAKGIRPLLTLEPHREEDVYPSLEGLLEVFRKYPLF
ncbi:sugar phosphate isomerase/epimerase family protein [Thermosulfuriphilus sp.]